MITGAPPNIPVNTPTGPTGAAPTGPAFPTFTPRTGPDAPTANLDNSGQIDRAPVDRLQEDFLQQTRTFINSILRDFGLTLVDGQIVRLPNGNPAPAAPAAQQNAGPNTGPAAIPAPAGTPPRSQQPGLGPIRQVSAPQVPGVTPQPTSQTLNSTASQPSAPNTGAQTTQTKGNTMSSTAAAGGAGGTTAQKIDTTSLEQTKEKAVALYAAVQDAAIQFEFDQAGPKLARDKAKSVTG